MLLLSGALVSGPYALITTAVSADLVSGGSWVQNQAWCWRAGRLFHAWCEGLCWQRLCFYEHPGTRVVLMLSLLKPARAGAALL